MLLSDKAAERGPEVGEFQSRQLYCAVCVLLLRCVDLSMYGDELHIARETQMKRDG